MTSSDSRLARNANIVLEISCSVKPDETVIICTGRMPTYYTDRQKLNRYAGALAAATVELGAHPIIMDLKDFLASPAFEGGRVLEPVGAAFKTADVVINTMDSMHTSRLIGRQDNDDEFLTARRRWVFLQSNGMDEWDLSAEEVGAIRPRTERLLALLGRAKEVHVTSPAGTDFRFEVGPGSNATPILGIVPLYGEVAIAPRQGSESGLIVVDGPTQMGVRTQDELDREPLRIVVKDGQATDFSGDVTQVERLKAFIASGDPPARHIDEVGIPTTRVRANDAYWWSDGTHHCETVHIALGNNLQRDSHVHGARHMDGEVIRPTVSLDGQAIVKDAEFAGDLAG